MRNIFTRATKKLLWKCGYSIARRQNHNPKLFSIPLDQERDSSEYDDIWSNKEFITKSYLSDGRLSFYHALCNHMQCEADIHTFGSVVDIGCGPGYLLKLVAELNPEARLVGLDVSPEVLKVASTTCPSATFRTLDIYEEVGEIFDLATCTEVLEHLDYPQKALERLTRAARTIVLTVPNGRLDTYPGHINYWSMRSWEIFLEPYVKKWECDTSFLCGEEKIATIMRRRD